MQLGINLLLFRKFTKIGMCRILVSKENKGMASAKGHLLMPDFNKESAA
jgi:hypothetical protein